jgi:uncharacterized protein YlxP (DUF503 family)
MPEASSLKDKRHWVKGLKDRLRKRCNVAVAEIGYQESHTQGLVAAVTVSGDRSYAEKVLQASEIEAASLLGPLLVDVTIEWLA